MVDRPCKPLQVPYSYFLFTLAFPIAPPGPAGARLVVEDTPEGVLLKPVPLFAVTKPKDVFGSLPCSGAPKSLEEMQAGIATEARRRHARG